MSDQRDYRRLSAIPIFRDLDKNELDVVFNHVFEQNVKKDNVLFVEGMPGESLYIIMSGGIEITKETKNKEKILLALMGSGDMVGEMSLIDAEPRSATAVTTEDSVLLVITKRSFNEILRSDSQIAAKILMGLLKVISRRLRIIDNKIEEIRKIVKKQ
ncbi:MAG: cyclic nucleotide-binding domain-containing protein [Smithella sp.]|nr:cyclic nucleotide-binding domain-containing protein [Smithella sp.]